MNAQTLQDQVKQAITSALSGKSGELTSADIDKAQEAVDKKLQAASEQADRQSGSQR